MSENKEQVFIKTVQVTAAVDQINRTTVEFDRIVNKTIRIINNHKNAVDGCESIKTSEIGTTETITLLCSLRYEGTEEIHPEDFEDIE